MRTLVRGGWVVGFSGGGHTLLRDGVVVFEDDRVVHVGSRFVPTLTEKGQPEISLSTWAELWAPAKTPRPIVDRLAQALEKTMKDPAVVSAIEKAGAATLKLVERENEVVRSAARKLGLAR